MKPAGPGYRSCQPAANAALSSSAQVKYCDLCGAPVIPGKVPEPDDASERSGEESTGPVEDQTSEQDGEEIPEPDTDEIPEDNDEETIVPAEDETPHHHKEEIQEPDTDELLEQYGKEYEEDETLASCHTQKPRSSIKHEAKKPVTVPGSPERGSSETVDDALFLSPGKPEAPAKPRVDRTRIIIGCIVLIMMSVAVYFIGLPMLTDKNPQVAEITPTPVPTNVGTITPTPTKTSTPASRALIPLPTQTIPSGPNIPLRGPEKPGYFKDHGHFHGKWHKKCGYQGHPSGRIRGNGYHPAPKRCKRDHPCRDRRRPTV